MRKKATKVVVGSLVCLSLALQFPLNVNAGAGTFYNYKYSAVATKISDEKASFSVSYGNTASIQAYCRVYMSSARYAYSVSYDDETTGEIAYVNAGTSEKVKRVSTPEEKSFICKNGTYQYVYDKAE